MSIQPKTTILDDTPLVERIRAIVVPAGVTTAISWTVLDDAGLPLDITAAPPISDPAVSPPIRLRGREAAYGEACVPETAGTIVTAGEGKVSIPIDATKLKPGVYEADLAVCNQDTGAISTINRFYLLVETSLFGQNGTTGPLTRQQIRLHIRDSSATENRLLDQVLFDDAEIAEAIVQPLRTWNNMTPPVAYLSTTDVPIELRGLWLQGTISVLYRMAALWYHKNALDVSAGGVTVGDMNKFQVCDQIAKDSWEEFLQAAKAQKVSMNVRSGFRHKMSPYGWYGRFPY